MSSEDYGSRRVCVSVFVFVKSHLTLEVSLRPETLSRTQRAMKVKIFVAFSLKLGLSRATALPALYAAGHFLIAEYAHALL